MSGNINFNGWINDDGSENYKCRAWVNFNGTGTVAIREAGNVSSITDNGTGNYTVNFTTAMPDANYATILGGNRDSVYGSFISWENALVSSVQIKTWNISTTPRDWVGPCVSIFR